MEFECRSEVEMSEPAPSIPFAATPEPPYWAVIFTARRAAPDPAYEATAARMVELARDQPGFLGIESARDNAGVGITVSYWRDEESIRRWKLLAEHLEAQRLGRAQWYSGYVLRVARVERAYTLESSERAGLT
jgi:heme-degrading monooxygenase HmoA